MNKPMMQIVATLVLILFFVAAISVLAQRRNSAETPKVPEGVTVYRDVAYVTDGHERQKLDLYVPEVGENLPLIIWVHGGAWRGGDKAHYVRMEYLKAGYAGASINYRLSQHAIFPAQIEDVKAAVRWLRTNAETYRLDPNRFAAWGSSAGGHLVAMLGTAGDVAEFEVGENLKVSSRVQAVVDYFGPTTSFKWTRKAFQRVWCMTHLIPQNLNWLGAPFRNIRTASQEPIQSLMCPKTIRLF